MKGRKANLKAVEGGLSGVPKAPVCIPPEFVAEWNAIGADMAARQILTAPALGLLETYILARHSVRECHAAIREHGLLVPTAHGMKKPNPASGMLKASLEAVARLSGELGISPASRSKATFQPKDGGDDEWSEMDL